MSRIGKKTIIIPNGVDITIEGKKLIVKGKYGTLERTILDNVEILLEFPNLNVKRKDDTKKSRAFHGLTRALLKNMVLGVNEQFSKTLIAEGVGYKFQVEKEKLIMNVGFTHPVEFKIPKELTIKLDSNTQITINGIDKEKVGFLAAKIREIRPPEPYKGKGIRYQNEKIIRKAGKTGK